MYVKGLHSKDVELKQMILGVCLECYDRQSEVYFLQKNWEKLILLSNQVKKTIYNILKCLETSKHANALYHRGLAYFNTGNIDKATNDFTNAKILDPKNPLAESYYMYITSL